MVQGSDDLVFANASHRPRATLSGLEEAEQITFGRGGRCQVLATAQTPGQSFVLDGRQHQLPSVDAALAGGTLSGPDLTRCADQARAVATHLAALHRRLRQEA